MESQLGVKSKPKKVEVDPLEAVAGEVESAVKSLKGLVEWYWVDRPWAAVAIIKKDTSYFYHIVTPNIGPLEFEILNRVYHRLIDRLCLMDGSPSAVFNKEASKLIKSYAKVDPIEEAKIIYYLRRKSFGYDGIDPVYKDPFIEDISCNGPNLPVYVYHVGYGFIPTNNSFNQDYLDDFVSHLAELADRHISIGFPVVEASLPDGSRLTAFWRKEVSDRGSGFAIRKIRVDPFTPVDLVRLETFNSELMALLWLFVELGANMLIIGGTASGKTTTLNACCLFIPENRRIISIEDTREVKLVHDNWVPLVTREEKKIDGLPGGLDAMYLLKRALRMRAEYLIVGEVRGEEARILFQAMNTGHIVFSTMHAGSVEEAFTRLFNPPISVAPAMVLPLDLIVVQSIVQIEDREVRRCTYVGEVKEVDVKNKKVSLRQLYSWDPKKDKIVKVDTPTRIFEKSKRFRRWDEKEVLEEVKKRKILLEYAISKGIRGYMGFTELLKSFKKGQIKGGVSSRL